MKFYMNHGRTESGPPTDVDGNVVDDWGFDGPTLEGVTGFHCTYGLGGTFTVYFATASAAAAAREKTGWREWDENALTAAFNTDSDLLQIWNPERERVEYFGDWGVMQ